LFVPSAALRLLMVPTDMTAHRDHFSRQPPSS
jgi:hypothetical protein